MQRWKFKISLAGIALATTALLAACGGGDATAPLTAQTITFSPATTGTVGTPIPLSATSSSSLAVSFSATPASVCSVSGTSLTLASAGTCSVKADQAGNSTFSAATTVSKDIVVSAVVVKVAQATLVAVATPTSVITSATSTLSSTGGSGTGLVTFAVTTGTCSITTSGTTTTLTAPATAGSCTVTATKATDTTYLVATSTPATVTIAAPTALTFASGYTSTGVDTVNYTRAGRSVELGAFNWYQSSATGGSDWSNFWWNGISPLTENVPSFYYGIGLASTTTVPYIAAFVNAPNDGSIALSGQTKLRIAVWGNDELTGKKVPTFKVFIQAKDTYQSGACYLEAEAPLITPTAVGAQTYTLNLSDFTIKNNCTGSNVTTVAQLLAKPIGAVHVQVLKANMYFSGTTVSPNGINVGPISFQP